MTLDLDLSYIAAPMVKQSDLPFRTLVHRYGATLSYTQMLIPEQIVGNQEYLEFHRRDLSMRNGDPVVVQLCGNDSQVIVEAGKKLQDLCQGIDLNLGCPQESARDGHFGAYLLGQKDWPLVENIGTHRALRDPGQSPSVMITVANYDNFLVSNMSHSFITPVSTKIRLCQPVEKTLEFAERLQAQGSSWVTLHARNVSARRRRQGAADLSQVKRLKDSPTIHVPIVSNGNVRTFSDLSDNLSMTGADGLMVGETLLGNPWLVLLGA
ncbi:hypothetical protein AAF712_003578 [Marasmius tenuissimus]|uniref:tRNA-dihydrouridine(16/17) synthase [NAD(P)(+)] n=1 Tax=Marasmius tenuissimus TaxID=585030 RepID=A0ABR3A6U3_9AGAR